jgi:hypothetical protein
MVFDNLPAETRDVVEQHAARAMGASGISRSLHGNFRPKLGDHRVPLVGSLALIDNKYAFIKAAPLSDEAKSWSLGNEAAIVCPCRKVRPCWSGDYSILINDTTCAAGSLHSEGGQIGDVRRQRFERGC